MKFRRTSLGFKAPVAEWVPNTAELVIGKEPDVRLYVKVPPDIKLVIVTPELALSTFK